MDLHFGNDTNQNMDDKLSQADFRSVRSIEFPNKNSYLSDIDNILFADTGRVDAMNSNLFFREAGQLLYNAIFLFEKGFFDCAFYSLRQSVEISITTLFLASNKGKIKKWNNLEPGFERGRMITYLKKHEGDFEDIRLKMKDFFEEIGEITKSIDKYVHKQGYKTFYTVRRSFDVEKKHPIKSLISDFEKCLNACIGMVTINRLALDPIPILLMDDEIIRKMRPMMAEAFSERFISTYLGEKHLKAYKRTNIYSNYYEYFIKLESQNDAVFDLIHNQYIDTSKIEEIVAQVHLLDVNERTAFILFIISNEIYRIITDDGAWYFSTTQPKEKEKSIIIGSSYYEDFFRSEINYNEKFGEAYISRCFIDKNGYYVLHNEKLSEAQISQIESFSKDMTDKVRATNDHFLDLLINKNDKSGSVNLD